MKNIIIVALIAITLGQGYLLFTNKEVPTFGGPLYYAGDMVNTGVTVGTASTTVVLPASTSNREYAIITNAATNTAYISLGEYAIGGTGIAIPANGSYEFGENNQYQGVVYGIASTTVRLSVIYNN